MNEDFVRKCIQRHAPRGWAADLVALDIGANHGAYTNLLAQKYGTTFAFEPHPVNAEVLIENIKESHIQVVKKAVTDSDGVAKLYVNEIPGMHTMQEEAPRQEKWGHRFANFIEVETVTVDTHCKRAHVGLMKVDVEGGEEAVIRGALKVIERDRPTIILETHQTADVEALAKLLRDRDYVFTDENGDKVKEMQRDVHYLCEPKEAA
jgi:FkbM family methyltransferase